jgi:hypothetical protein
MANWIEYTHTEYDQLKPKWRYAIDHYESLVIEKDNIETYLIKRAQGESADAFEERKKLADYTPVFGHAVDSLAGMLFAAESKATRIWDELTEVEDGLATGDGLGNPEDPDSIAGKLTRDCDGTGINWETKWKMSAIDFMVTHRLWCYVEGVSDERGIPKIHVIRPNEVTNWREDEHGNIVEVLLHEVVDVRDSLSDDPNNMIHQYIHFTVEGWTKYQSGGSDKERVYSVVDSGEYEFINPSGERVLPIFLVELPLRRNVGYILAKKNNAIFNKESDKDNLLRLANHPKLVLSADDTLYSLISTEIIKGSNVLQEYPDKPGQHRYIAPDTSPAQVAIEDLQKKIEGFYYTAFQQYSDAARQRTATEVRQDLSRGIGAFLELLAGAVDELENGAFMRVEQIMLEDQSKWGRAHVKRSDDFMPIDADAHIQKLIDTYFPQGVPIGKTGKLAALKKIADHSNIQYDEVEAQQSISSRESTDVQQDSFFNQVIRGGI